ncbi:hypothetical protein P154DRAFT_579326 [Amniculicola lignicola CBS 123094]|uniref:GST C-terminal domain-containing protein n=1 Tax=Amniculicola lignicola CBS 123094 TaxID=1392246 RepID=A0A6A5W800_9PLEO|nr:hypothetical protein P154DRAFT_579326 [Amniculicola lignicola CBS 123094]
MKKLAYESISVPAIEDPNAGITLRESGAIIYGYSTRYLARVRILGRPWFALYHPEKIPSAVDSYVEIRRVSGVLDRVLQDKEYLVGGKFSYADAAFVMGYAVLFLFEAKLNLETEFPVLSAWLEQNKARPAIAKIIRDREAAMKA